MTYLDAYLSTLIRLCTKVGLNQTGKITISVSSMRREYKLKIIYIKLQKRVAGSPLTQKIGTILLVILLHRVRPISKEEKKRNNVLITQSRPKLVVGIV